VVPLRAVVVMTLPAGSKVREARAPMGSLMLPNCPLPSCA
jgi:hypothetical protein